jgi:rod shape-determining protein MreC
MQWRNHALILEAQLKRYQQLLHAVPDPALSYRMAQVIGHASQPFEETMILNAGKADGVKPGQAVIDPRGLVGRIFLAGEHTSWVLLLTDLNSRIPVMIEPEHVHAIMAGTNELAPVLETISQGVTLKDGDQVVTSGDGGLLPPGLAVGSIVSTGGSFRVVLLSDPANAEDVDIVDYKTPIETPPSVSAGDLPSVSAGLPPLIPQPPAMTAPAQAPPPAAPAGSAPAKPVTAPQTANPQGADDDDEDH